jgi:hypothetical protein
MLASAHRPVGRLAQLSPFDPKRERAPTSRRAARRP